ncbi:protein MIZU-KUSSEI 1-like [Chenopodium quinoa]|uniref:protein MIZU-KUSSEI 1-like n=1 Tax=Chenopodium quinoa TaxID=63459 RepID=UPI000B7750DE|nr:protein MIZU-KUSSEI 1-like [Chenopodium quinoa]
MRTIMSSKAPGEASFSFSRRYFNWRKKPEDLLNEEDCNDEEGILRSFSSLPSEGATLNMLSSDTNDNEVETTIKSCVLVPKKTKNKNKIFVSKFTSFFTRTLSSNKSGDNSNSNSNSNSNHRSATTLGSKVVGTLFGFRRGHVHIAFQEDPKTTPAFLIELSTPTSVLVREMASGLVRVALECDKKVDKKGVKLLEEPLWRAYCNGKKCGYAMRRECGPHEWRVLRSVGPITMGAGVLPREGGSEDDGDSSDGSGGGGGQHGRAKAEGELMYMRAKFERIVGSKDSEAFYMMNPDGNGGPELSVYLLRV